MKCNVERVDPWAEPDATTTPTTLSISTVSAESAAAIAFGKYFLICDVPFYFRVGATGGIAVTTDWYVPANLPWPLVITAEMVTNETNFLQAITTGAASATLRWRKAGE